MRAPPTLQHLLGPLKPPPMPAAPRHAAMIIDEASARVREPSRSIGQRPGCPWQ